LILLLKTIFIERGSPWENGYIESFNGKLRDELPDREIFTRLNEADQPPSRIPLIELDLQAFQPLVLVAYTPASYGVGYDYTRMFASI
jgi:transposase InsO family protein